MSFRVVKRDRSAGRAALKLAGAGLALATLAACSSGGSSGTASTSATKSPIAVGGICDQTGQNNYSESCAAAKAYFDMINSEGGVNGHPIQYTVEDGASTASTTAQVGTRLIDVTKVVALVGGANTYQCTENAKLMASSGVYALDGLSADSQCWLTAYDTPLNNGPLLGEAVALYFLGKTVGTTNVCTMWPNFAAAIASLNNLNKVMTEVTGHGFRKTLLWGGGDLTPIVVGAKQAGCKAVILGGSESTYISAMQTAHAQGMTNGSIVWMGLTTGYTQHVAQAVSQDSGYWTNTEFLPWSLSGNAALSEFTKLQQQARFSLDGTAEAGYLAARLFVAAVKTIKGPINRQSVGEALRSLKSADTGGLTAQPFTWGKYNVSSQFLQLKTGQWVPYGASGGQWYSLNATSQQVTSIVTGR